MTASFVRQNSQAVQLYFEAPYFARTLDRRLQTGRTYYQPRPRWARAHRRWARLRRSFFRTPNEPVDEGVVLLPTAKASERAVTLAEHLQDFIH